MGVACTGVGPFDASTGEFQVRPLVGCIYPLFHPKVVFANKLAWSYPYSFVRGNQETTNPLSLSFVSGEVS
jgi:hypothetical protein